MTDKCVEEIEAPMTERWQDRVEAAMDEVVGAAVSVGHDAALYMPRAQKEDNAILNAARIDLFLLVTDGRCLGCGGSVTYVNFGKGLQRLCNSECGWTDEDTND